MRQLFTMRDAWHGGFYELVFELPAASETAIKEALVKLWNMPALEGCYLRSDVEPVEQLKVSPKDTENEGHWYGIATFPEKKQCVCGSFWGDYEESGCWMTLYLPLGSLGAIFPVEAYPFLFKIESSPESWLKEVNNWLKDIAIAIYPQVKFNIALIGFEVDFFDLKKKLASGIPHERWEGILLPHNDKLTWHPPTFYDPPYRLDKRLL